MTERLDTDNKLVGTKQVSRALEKKGVEVLYIAEDAELEVLDHLEDQARAEDVEIVYVDSMKKLGKICKIDISAAVAALLK